MKMKHMSRYYIRLLLILLISTPLFAQDNENKLPQDSTAFKEKYGLRFGIDLSRLGRTAFDPDYSGFEINADYRLTKSLYVACELGFEDKSTNTYSNALQTLAWIKKSKINSITLITSNYHMPRALMEFKVILKNIKIYPYVLNDKNLVKKIDIDTLIVEYIKFTIARIRKKISSDF